VVRSETKKTNPAMIPIFFMMSLLVVEFEDVEADGIDEYEKA
jgi:hypothetical protein